MRTISHLYAMARALLPSDDHESLGPGFIHTGRNPIMYSWSMYDGYEPNYFFGRIGFYD